MSTTTQDEGLGIDHQVVLILVGLVASGKVRSRSPNTACKRDQRGASTVDVCGGAPGTLSSLSQVQPGRTWRSEEGGSSDETESAGGVLCLHRQNERGCGRAHWLDIASEFPGTAAWVLYFDTPYNICAARLQNRTNHPTIASVAEGIRALRSFSSTFQPPVPHEGYDRLLRVTPNDHPNNFYTREDILATMHVLRDSPPIERAADPVQPRITQFFRGGGNQHSHGGARAYHGGGGGAGGPALHVGASRGRGPWHSQPQPWTARGRPHAHNRGYAPYRGGRGSMRGGYSDTSNGRRHDRSTPDEARVCLPEGPSSRGNGSSKDPLVLD
ncbi:hypothetical protein EVG20_g3050 [Dentipellis fragilis]|uniref:Uncharacterized protein n=1 Tax=Dentipellis fragilis TaxID=205917 RepID=A0A4Y9Z6B7_9AGAM|nr:hypothetical protein EVG20_g3050 [Dentipellis fragilis]